MYTSFQCHHYIMANYKPNYKYIQQCITNNKVLYNRYYNVSIRILQIGGDRTFFD